MKISLFRKCLHSNLILIFGLLVTVVFTSGAVSAQNIRFETEYLVYEIGSDGRNSSFIDKQSGIDYLKSGIESSCARIKTDDKSYDVTSAEYGGGVLTLRFGVSGISAEIRVISKSDHLIWEVSRVTGGTPEALTFLNIPLTLAGKPVEPFAACSFSLNIFTHVPALPALQSTLEAHCYKRFGIAGARAAIIGVPQNEILPVIKSILVNTKDIPHSTVGGAWAKDEPKNYGSYLFNFGTLTEENVGEWISMVKSLGFTQIDNHGGSRFFRFGDFELNREKWPDGWDNFKRINEKLHANGIGAIFHTYAFFIDKAAKYVTPVPSPYLDSFRSFTLAKPVSDSDTEIEVAESTADVSTITGFFVQNSITLHIGDELITFKGVTKEPPYKFTECTRGAFGTRAASHGEGGKARHLKEMFGYFVPDVDTPLFAEIAKNHADVVNYCDFDGIYLDAIDGSSILRGGEDAWYYATKFIFEMRKHFKRPVGMEMSAMWHHFWMFRTRWQAWDYPVRGQKRFIDIHAETVNGGLLVPLHLGWWNFQTWNPPQVETTYPDVIEYLGCKLIGHNAGLSLTGAVDRENLQKIPLYRRLVGILKQYEDLRHENYFDESVKAKLREPGKEFTLFQDDGGKWNFKPVQYDKHKVEDIDDLTGTWKSDNPFGRQPLKVRIEALMSAEPYDSPDAVVLAGFDREDEIGEKLSENGVLFGLHSSREMVKESEYSGKFSAINGGDVERKGAWTLARKTYNPVLNLKKNQALGVWIYGDGSGALINFRLESPFHLAHGAYADHYVTVDFTGWRYCELIETEAARSSDYEWPEGWGLYHAYREMIRFDAVEAISIWYNNLPEDRKVTCFISPVKALPMTQNVIVNPRVTVGGKTITFPVTMKSGQYLEFRSESDCKLFGPQGELLRDVTCAGEIPVLEPGMNSVTFDCEKERDISARAHVTVISEGEPLQ